VRAGLSSPAVAVSVRVSLRSVGRWRQAVASARSPSVTGDDPASAESSFVTRAGRFTPCRARRGDRGSAGLRHAGGHLMHHRRLRSVQRFVYLGAVRVAGLEHCPGDRHRHRAGPAEPHDHRLQAGIVLGVRLRRAPSSSSPPTTAAFVRRRPAAMTVLPPALSGGRRAVVLPRCHRRWHIQHSLQEMVPPNAAQHQEPGRDRDQHDRHEDLERG
jgi:hypothetical protein